MDYTNLTAEKIAEIRGTASAIPKLVTESCMINFETMTDVEKLMHKLMCELDTKALEEAREKMKIEINSIYGVPKNN